MLNSTAFYIVFAVVASIALWLYVTYVENPDKTVTVTNIPVTFVNSEKLQDADLVVTKIDRETISLEFTGKRNAVTKLSNSNVILTVDLNDVVLSAGGMAGLHQLSYEVTYPSGINKNYVEVSGTSADYVTVTVERMVTRRVPVSGEYNGKVESGFQAQALQFEPETVVVSGPEATVTKINCAWVSLESDTISKSISESLNYKLLDEDRNEIPIDSSLVLSDDAILVTLPIYMVKDVMLSVNLTYSSTATTENTRCEISPSVITLTGDSEILEDLNQIVLGTIDLTDFALTANESMPIPIPNEVTNMTGSITADVSVEVLGMSTARMSASNIAVRNETVGYQTTVITQSLDVTIRADEETLSQIEPSNIRIVADLAELGNTTGTFSVPAKVNIDGFVNADAIGDYKISVIIS